MKNRLTFAVSLALLSTANTYASVPILSSKGENLKSTVEHNMVGLPVINQHNKKINYTSQEIQNAINKNLKSTSTKSKSANKISEKSLNINDVSNIYATRTNFNSDTEFVKKHQLYTYGVGIGAFGMEKIDINSDGIYEIVMGNDNGWSVQQFQSSTNSYQLVHHVPNRSAYSEKLSKLIVTYHESNGRPMIATVYKDGLIEIYKGTNFDLYSSFNADITGVNDMVITDANNDGERDIVLVSDDETKVLDFDNFSEQLMIPEGAETVRVGQVYGDEKVELILSSGFVFQAENSNFFELWRSTTEFGDWIELGNIDDDEQLEVIAADSWSHYRAVDVVEQIVVWEESNFDTNSFRLIDVTGDDIPEIILGDGQWGDVHAHDIKTRELIWSVDNPEHGVTNSLVFDGDNDGNLEVYWGAGYTSSGGDYLFAYDLTLQQREWQNFDLNGPFTATAIDDIDHDGKTELVFASWESDSGYEDGLIYVVDAKSFGIKHVTDGSFFDRRAWTGIHDIALENVDDDPQLEILVTTGRLYDGALYVIDGRTYERENEFLFDSGSILYAMDTYDIDNDGVAEVITGAGKEHTGSPGTFVYAINADDGTTNWISASINSGWTDTQDIHVVDLNGDGIVEVLAVNQGISFVNSQDGSIENTIEGDYLAVSTLQYDSDSAIEILAAKENGLVDIIDAESLNIEVTLNLCSDDVNAIFAIDNSQFLATCGSEVMGYDLDGNFIDWSEDTGDSDLGLFNNIVSKVINGKQVFLVGGKNGVYVYRQRN